MRFNWIPAVKRVDGLENAQVSRGWGYSVFEDDTKVVYSSSGHNQVLLSLRVLNLSDSIT